LFAVYLALLPLQRPLADDNIPRKLGGKTQIGYWIGRYMVSEQVMALADKNEKAGKLIRYMDRHSNIVVFIVRLVPGPLPFDIMSWLFGASRLSFVRYLFYSVLSRPGVSRFVIYLERVQCSDLETDYINNIYSIYVKLLTWS